MNIMIGKIRDVLFVTGSLRTPCIHGRAVGLTLEQFMCCLLYRETQTQIITL